MSARFPYAGLVGRRFEQRLNRGRTATPTRESKYDAAQTTTENINRWKDATALSANAENSPDVRAKLRNRSRYEYANNGYYSALIDGLANDTIGTGPRLQLRFGEGQDDAARIVENLFAQWWKAVNFSEKLRLMDMTETRDGEVFGVFANNPRLPEGTPQVDVIVVESEQVSTPGRTYDAPGSVDGIRFDRFGNPTEYDILREHPGDRVFYSNALAEFDTYPAERVIHLYNRKRPSQARGVPSLTAALDLFGQMRMFTGAVLGAAQLSAMLAAFITQQASPSGSMDEAPEIEAMDTIPFARNMLMTLAGGQDVKAFTPAQPIPSYGDFKTQVLTEAGRGINAPQNISTGSSAAYNYSSGRLDHLPYQTSIRVRRSRLVESVLDRAFAEWLRESRLLAGYLPDDLPPQSEWVVSWQWPAFTSIDPVKDADANEILLRTGQTTLQRVCAERGEDWEEVLVQRAREKKRAQELGLEIVAVEPKNAPKSPDNTANGSANE